MTCSRAVSEPRPQGSGHTSCLKVAPASIASEPWFGRVADQWRHIRFLRLTAPRGTVYNLEPGPATRQTPTLPEYSLSSLATARKRDELLLAARLWPAFR